MLKNVSGTGDVTYRLLPAVLIAGLMMCSVLFAYGLQKDKGNPAMNNSASTAAANKAGKKGKSTKSKETTKDGGTMPSPKTPANDSPPSSSTKDTPKDQSTQGGQTSPQPCRSVRLGPLGDASSFEDLSGTGSVSVKTAGARELIMCGPPANVDVLETAVQSLSGQSEHAGTHEAHYVRLFYTRQAGDIAAAINNSGGLGTPVKALGNDVLVFPSESEADDHAIHELKRWIALIDVPRPEVSLSAWSIQLSSKDWHSIQRESTAVRAMVAGFNQELHESLQRGWRYLGTQDEAFLDKDFSRYLRLRYLRTDADLPDCPNVKETAWNPCPAPELQERCTAGEYCLGYTRMFSPLQPSLTSMLITLLAASDSATAIPQFVDCLEGRKKEKWEIKYSLETQGPPCYEYEMAGNAESIKSYYERDYKSGPVGRQPTRPNNHQQRGFEPDKNSYSRISLSSCENDDYQWYESQNNSDFNPQQSGNENLHPAFSCFRQQLMESLIDGRHKALLRSALADFLFHYKTSEIYPQDFIAWNRGASAQRLDNFFNPLIVEFNRDLGVYLRVLNDSVTRARARDRNVDFTSEGQITVRVLSNTAASVSTTTQSFFPAPPIFSVRDFIGAMKGGGGSSDNGSSGDGKSGSGDSGNTNSSNNSSGGSTNSGNSGNQGGGSGNAAGSAVPLLFSSNLNAVAAQSLMALLQSVQAKTTQIGRDLNLNITANTLSGASSAELTVELNSQEHDPPRLLDLNNNTSSNDNIDRVATHNTSTKVRVDSLKLFEISSFSATLTRSRSVPLILPFVEIPYIGSLLRLHLSPGTTYHRSFAIVSAVIVPTAADIANAIEFRSDLEASRLPKAQWNLPPAKTSPEKSKSEGDPAGSATVNVQVGCCSCPKCPPPPPPTPKPTPPPHPGYYWVVTHYREGISISEPFQSPGDEANSKNVQLVWDAPRVATGFDLYWSSDQNKDHACPAVPFTLHRNSYELVEIVEMTNCEKKTGLPSETAIYSPLPNQPGNLLEFHNQKLQCLEHEAEGTPDAACDKLKLQSTPVTRFGAYR